MNEISENQLNFAQRVADSLGSEIPREILNDRIELSKWIDTNLDRLPKDKEGRAIFKPSLKQIAYAERIAQDAGVNIPVPCYKNSAEMAKFIDTYQSRLKNRPTEKMVELAKKIFEFDPTVGDPSDCFEDFDTLRDWLDKNFPEEWKNFEGGGGRRKQPVRRGRKKESMEDLI